MERLQRRGKMLQTSQKVAFRPAWNAHRRAGLSERASVTM